MSIAQNLQQVHEQIAQVAGGRCVTVVAVSKGQSVEKIREAHAAGHRVFGESYVQEFLAKREQLRGLTPSLEWHFIGPLQGNKTVPVALNFEWVHALTREKIARRLSATRAEAGLAPLNVCVQVNLSGESSKAGLHEDEVLPFAESIAGLPGLRLRGLMTLPEPTPDRERQHLRFAGLHKLLDGMNREGMELDTLSMGMSQDFSAAVAEGSTIVRIGTAIFGGRQKS